MKPSLIRLLGLVALGAMAPPAEARNTNWNSAVFDNLQTSSGAPLDASFRFEIGIFDASFTPTAANLEQWATNWQVYDAAIDGDGWNPAASYVTISTVLDTDGTSDSIFANPTDVFPTGTQAYMWVYNSKTIDPSSEWALITNLTSTGPTDVVWSIPDPSDSLAPPVDWALSDADTAVYGNTNGVQGGGDTPATPGVSIQTAVVPEPGGALLVGISGFLYLLRRRGRRR